MGRVRMQRPISPSLSRFVSSSLGVDLDERSSGDVALLRSRERANEEREKREKERRDGRTD
jgi:hypothetical protein